MEGYARRNGKVFSYCEPKEFFDFYNRTSVGSRMVKLDGKYYHLDDDCFRKVGDDDIVVFNKNKLYWSKEDNRVIPKSKFDSEYAIVKSAPKINGFLMEFYLYMGFHSMIEVFKKMLEEVNDKHYYEESVNIKNQLQWIVNNQDVFLYMLS